MNAASVLALPRAAMVQERRPADHEGEEMRRLSRRVNDADVLEGFSHWLTYDKGRAKRTIQTYLQQLELCSRMLDTAIAQVTPRQVRHELKMDTGVSVGTRNLRVTTFKVLHRYAGEDELPWFNPSMLTLSPVSVPKRLPKAPLSLLEARRVLDACETPNEKRVAYLGLYAGTRVSESVAMNESHVHGDRFTFIGKGDKERTVPIHKELRKHLDEIFSERPASTGVLTVVMTRLRDRLCLRDIMGKDATTHTFRRTFADFVYDKAGHPREVVKMLLGHGSDVTDLYAPVRYGPMRQAVDDVDYTIGTPVQLSLFA